MGLATAALTRDVIGRDAQAQEKAASESIRELEAIFESSRKRGISPEAAKLLSGLFSKMHFFGHDGGEYRKFAAGKGPSMATYFEAGGITKLPAPAVLALKSFISSSGIKMLHEEDVGNLTLGKQMVVGGTMKPGGRAWEKQALQLEKSYGIHVRVEDDGRVYIYSSAGKAIQELANLGISVDMFPGGIAVINNSLYLPQIPPQLSEKCRLALVEAGNMLKGGDSESALKIAGMVQNIISSYRLSEGYQEDATRALRFSGVKLGKQELATLKKDFSEEEFRRVSGMGYADFEKLGRSMGNVAAWHFLNAREGVMRAAESYVSSLGALARHAPAEELAMLEKKCADAAQFSGVAQKSYLKGQIIAGGIPEIIAIRKSHEEFANEKMPASITDDFILRKLETSRLNSQKLLWGVETTAKLMAFYSIAALEYGMENEKKPLAAVNAKINSSIKQLSILSTALNKEKERFFATIEDEALKAVFRQEKLPEFRAKLGVIMKALAQGEEKEGESHPAFPGAMNALEKDIARSSFFNLRDEEGSKVTLERAAEMLENLEFSGRLPKNEKNRRVYAQLLGAIDFSYRYTWRYRLNEISQEEKLRFDVSGAKADFSHLLQPAKARTIADVVSEERLAQRVEKDRPALTKYFQEKRLAVLSDAKGAAESFSMILPPEKKKEERVTHGVNHREGEVFEVRRTVEVKNPTAELAENISTLDAKFGVDSKKPLRLAPRELSRYIGEFDEAYNDASGKLYEHFDSVAFEAIVKDWPTHKRYTARSARFLEQHGNKIMIAAAVAGAVAGIFDSAGVGSAIEAAAAREAARRGIMYVVSRFGVAGLRGAIGYMSLTGRSLALTSALVGTAEVLEADKEKRFDTAKSAAMRTGHFAAYGLLSTAPALLNIPAMAWKASAYASGSFVLGSAAFNLYAQSKSDKPLTAMEKFVGFNDSLYVATVLAFSAPGKVLSLVRTMRGITEVARTGGAFAGDVVLTGLFASDPFIMEHLLKPLLPEENRSLKEITPKKIFLMHEGLKGMGMEEVPSSLGPGALPNLTIEDFISMLEKQKKKQQ